jgi:hypothetical protein
VPTTAITYTLGKDCQLFIEGIECKGVSDVLLREVAVDVDATGYGRYVGGSVVVARTYEVQIAVPDMAWARWLFDRRFVRSGSFRLPAILAVRLERGVHNIDAYFTVHSIDADEPIDGAVIPKFELREWGSGLPGPTGTT